MRCAGSLACPCASPLPGALRTSALAQASGGPWPSSAPPFRETDRDSPRARCLRFERMAVGPHAQPLERLRVGHRMELAEKADHIVAWQNAGVAAPLLFLDVDPQRWVVVRPAVPRRQT